MTPHVPGRSNESWVADPTVAWNIVLTARLAAPPDVAEITRALARLADERGWRVPDSDAIHLGTTEELVRRFASDAGDHSPVTLGLDGNTLVIRAHHRHLDGGGLLALLHALTGTPLTSSARGVGDRPEGSALRSTVLRLTEVAFAPPARVQRSASTPVDHDAFAARTVPGSPRTAELVLAGAAAIGRWNAARGGSTRRVAVAVGVSRTGGADLSIGENSGWLRIRNVERLTPDEVARAVSTAPLVATPTGVLRSRPVRDRLVSTGLKVLAPRLGSTLLVSHLGRVDAPDVEDLAFFPVTGGGSGMSLGAVTLRDRTVLTLRARGRQHSDEGLQEILETLGALVESARG